MELKGSQTEKNLWEAIKGESVAKNKYTFYAKVAKKEGYEQIGAIFEETAFNEEMHAKIWMKELELIKGTLENLDDCISGENYEHVTMYPEFAKVARAEGFTKIANLFEKVGNIEENHEKRYITLKENIVKKRVFEREEPVTWTCRKCGNIHVGLKAPEVCPVCSHPLSYEEIEKSNY